MPGTLFFQDSVFHDTPTAVSSWIRQEKLKVQRTKLAYEKSQQLCPTLMMYQKKTRIEQMGTCLGDERVRMYDWVLNNMGIQPHDDQIEILRHYKHGLLPHFYKDEWDSESTRVLKEMGITEVPPLILTFAYRRLGKTYVTAMCCCAALLSIPNFEIVIFSTGGRIASRLRDLVRMMMNKIPGAAERVLMSGEQMYVRHGKPSGSLSLRTIKTEAGRSVMNSYPSDARSQLSQQHILLLQRQLLLLGLCKQLLPILDQRLVRRCKRWGYVLLPHEE